MKVTLPDVRIAFAHGLWTAKAPKGSDKKAYSASFLFKEGSEAFKIMEAAMLAVAEEEWPGKGKAMVAALKAKDRTCLHDGALKADEYDGYADHWYVSARSKVRPTVKNRDKSNLTEDDNVIYSGCHVYAFIDVWPQDSKEFGKRINCNLRGVQFYRDGDAFGGGRAADDDEFEELGVPQGEEDPVDLLS